MKEKKDYENVKIGGGYVKRIRLGNGGVDMMKMHFICV